jgi:hypothetical protein
MTSQINSIIAAERMRRDDSDRSHRQRNAGTSRRKLVLAVT